MLKILTQEEAEESKKEINEFLVSLDFDIKSKLYSLLRPLITQRNCNHDWVNYDSYDNEMPKDKKYCRKCSLICNK